MKQIDDLENEREILLKERETEKRKNVEYKAYFEGREDELEVKISKILNRIN